MAGGCRTLYSIVSKNMFAGMSKNLGSPLRGIAHFRDHLGGPHFWKPLFETKDHHFIIGKYARAQSARIFDSWCCSLAG